MKKFCTEYKRVILQFSYIWWEVVSGCYGLFPFWKHLLFEGTLLLSGYSGKS